MLGLLFTVVIAAAPVTETHAAPFVPWYVPRSLTLGVFINPPMATPHFRLAWEGAIISQPRNDLIWLVSAGSGIGAWLPEGMSAHYQHAFLAGLGYRSDRELIHWGFHVTAGALWYRAGFSGTRYPFESRVVGYVEGRLQFGFRIAGPLKLAAYFGYASPFVFNQRFPGNTYVGGVDTGVVLDWR